MKFNRITLATLVAVLAVFTSCKDDGANEETGSVVQTPALKAVINSSFSRDNMETYVSNYSTLFTRNGESTVSFSGQTARLKMTKEIGADLKNSAETSTAIQSRFELGTGFDDATLDAAGKVVKSKTSASTGLFGGSNESGQGKINVEAIEDFIVGFDAVKAAWANEASAGNPGFVNDNDGSKRYVNAKGYELDQLFTKSMSGALAYDQTVNHYMNRLDDNNDGTNAYKTANDAGEVKEGKTYTTMEHHWDEAFGYIYGNIGGENLIYKYIDDVASLQGQFAGFEEDVLEAFVLGRIAIVEKDYAARDAQVSFLREALGTVIAVRSVNYIVAGANFLDDTTNDNRVQDALHDLSEGYGFVNSLRYIVDEDGNKIFTDTEVDAYLDVLNEGNGVWDLVPADLINKIANPIAAKFSWSVNDVKTVQVSGI